MIVMRTLVLPLVAALLVPAAAAGAKTPALKHSRATLVSCDTEANTAVFRGALTTVRKARSLQMRFALQARPAKGGAFKHVVAPSFDQWLTSSPGKKAFVYDKRLEALAAGTSYRAVIRYRWRAADGHVLARAFRMTPTCTQPDDRPNLRATRIAVRPGISRGARTYLVRIANRGAGEAPAFATSLTVGGNTLTGSMGGPLAARSATTLAFLAPKCKAGSTLTATVDTGDAVDERNETDNRLTVPCPTRAGRRG